MSKNTKVELEVVERILALGLLRQWKGNLEDLEVVQEDLKQFPFTEEEKKELAIIEIPADKDGKGGSVQWKPDALPKGFTLSQKSVDFLVGEIKERSDKETISIADGPLVALYKKLI